MTRIKARIEPKGGITLDELEREVGKLLSLLVNRRPGRSTWNVSLLVQLDVVRTLLEIKAKKPIAKRVIDPEVLDKATEVFGSRRAARHWLTSPAYGLGWGKPVDYLNTKKGKKEILDYLGRIEFGVYC